MFEGSTYAVISLYPDSSASYLYLQEDDEEDEEVPVGPEGRGTERPAIYDVDAIHEKLEDIGWTMEQPWEETIVIMSSDATQLKDVDDDLARELSFYNQVSWMQVSRMVDCMCAFTG